MYDEIGVGWTLIGMPFGPVSGIGVPPIGGRFPPDSGMFVPVPKFPEHAASAIAAASSIGMKRFTF